MICYRCGGDFPTDAFLICRKMPDGRIYRYKFCSKCNTKRANAYLRKSNYKQVFNLEVLGKWRKKQKELETDWHWKKLLRWTKEQAAAMPDLFQLNIKLYKLKKEIIKHDKLPTNN